MLYTISSLYDRLGYWQWQKKGCGIINRHQELYKKEYNWIKDAYLRQFCVTSVPKNLDYGILCFGIIFSFILDHIFAMFLTALKTSEKLWRQHRSIFVNCSKHRTSILEYFSYRFQNRGFSALSRSLWWWPKTQKWQIW